MYVATGRQQAVSQPEEAFGSVKIGQRSQLRASRGVIDVDAFGVTAGNEQRFGELHHDVR